MEKTNNQNIINIGLGIAITIIVGVVIYIAAENNARDRDFQNTLNHIILHNGGYDLDTEGNIIPKD